MWFDLIDPALRSDDKQRNFFASSAERLDAVADQFLNALRQKQADSGVSRFLLSNESLLQQHEALGPFIARLKQQVTVRLIAYARDPRDWLPSAYNQWFVYHKTPHGQIPPYAEGGRRLLRMYTDLNTWLRKCNDIMTVRPFSKSLNVVEDFAAMLGVEMAAPVARSFERVETSESLLRAIYNARFPTGVLPDRFDRAFRRLDFAQSPSIAALVRDSFTYDQTDEIVAEQAALFAEIKDKLGLDLLSGPAPAQKTVDPEEMRHRALEHVLHIVMQQADRITHLEQIVRRLEAGTQDE
ncbi:polysaccharide biosynthesis protein [Roseovarius sp. A-2]|uniref:polysaccharide biosynthesis protein n=1 Tax=Roseovarius sp. A-2 TaxID=1570360 RepID=UPI0011194A22|nr:polysaccharide biosynthesis protein [Roseovarius sp. A-2]